MKIVRENIQQFKRGGDVKSTLGIGRKALHLKILSEWKNAKYDIKLFNFFSNWSSLTYFTIGILAIRDDKVFFSGFYGIPPHREDDTATMEGSFDLDNIEICENIREDETLKLREPVKKDPFKDDND